MINKLLFLVFLTLVPVFELRWSIPIGIFSGNIIVPFLGVVEGFALPLWIVFLVCVLSNIFLGFIAYFFFERIIIFFLRFKWLNKLYSKFVIRTRNKASPLIERYGFLGLILFIAVPLPGSGTWTGALVAHLFGFDLKRFFLANAFGVIIAGIIISIIFTGAFSLIGF